MAGYGILRSIIEIYRDDDDRGIYFGFSTSQIIGITSTDATVHWTAGTANAYAPVTGWELTGPAGSIDLPAGTTSYQLTGLQAGRAYAVSVRAVNLSGHSGWAGSLLTAMPTPAPVPA